MQSPSYSDHVGDALSSVSCTSTCYSPRKPGTGSGYTPRLPSALARKKVPREALRREVAKLCSSLNVPVMWEADEEVVKRLAHVKSLVVCILQKLRLWELYRDELSLIGGQSSFLREATMTLESIQLNLAAVQEVGIEVPSLAGVAAKVDADLKWVVEMGTHHGNGVSSIELTKSPQTTGLSTPPRRGEVRGGAAKKVRRVRKGGSVKKPSPASLSGNTSTELPTCWGRDDGDQLETVLPDTPVGGTTSDHLCSVFKLFSKAETDAAKARRKLRDHWKNHLEAVKISEQCNGGAVAKEPSAGRPASPLGPPTTSPPGADGVPPFPATSESPPPARTAITNRPRRSPQQYNIAYIRRLHATTRIQRWWRGGEAAAMALIQKRMARGFTSEADARSTVVSVPSEIRRRAVQCVGRSAWHAMSWAQRYAVVAESIRRSDPPKEVRRKAHRHEQFMYDVGDPDGRVEPPPERLPVNEEQSAVQKTVVPEKPPQPKKKRKVVKRRYAPTALVLLAGAHAAAVICPPVVVKRVLWKEAPTPTATEDVREEAPEGRAEERDADGEGLPLRIDVAQELEGVRSDAPSDAEPAAPLGDDIDEVGEKEVAQATETNVPSEQEREEGVDVSTELERSGRAEEEEEGREQAEKGEGTGNTKGAEGPPEGVEGEIARCQTGREGEAGEKDTEDAEEVGSVEPQREGSLVAGGTDKTEEKKGGEGPTWLDTVIREAMTQTSPDEGRLTPNLSHLSHSTVGGSFGSNTSSDSISRNSRRDHRRPVIKSSKSSGSIKRKSEKLGGIVFLHERRAFASAPAITCTAASPTSKLSDAKKGMPATVGRFVHHAYPALMGSDEETGQSCSPDVPIRSAESTPSRSHGWDDFVQEWPYSKPDREARLDAARESVDTVWGFPDGVQSVVCNNVFPSSTNPLMDTLVAAARLVPLPDPSIALLTCLREASMIAPGEARMRYATVAAKTETEGGETIDMSPPAERYDSVLTFPPDIFPSGETGSLPADAESALEGSVVSSVGWIDLGDDVPHVFAALVSESWRVRREVTAAEEVEREAIAAAVAAIQQASNGASDITAAEEVARVELEHEQAARRGGIVVTELASRSAVERQMRRQHETARCSLQAEESRERSAVVAEEAREGGPIFRRVLQGLLLNGIVLGTIGAEEVRRKALESKEAEVSAFHLHVANGLHMMHHRERDITHGAAVHTVALEETVAVLVAEEAAEWKMTSSTTLVLWERTERSQVVLAERRGFRSIIARFFTEQAVEEAVVTMVRIGAVRQDTMSDQYRGRVAVAASERVERGVLQEEYARLRLDTEEAAWRQSFLLHSHEAIAIALQRDEGVAREHLIGLFSAAQPHVHAAASTALFAVAGGLLQHVHLIGRSLFAECAERGQLLQQEASEAHRLLVGCERVVREGVEGCEEARRREMVDDSSAEAAALCHGTAAMHELYRLYHEAVDMVAEWWAVCSTSLLLRIEDGSRAGLVCEAQSGAFGMAQRCLVEAEGKGRAAVDVEWHREGMATASSEVAERSVVKVLSELRAEQEAERRDRTEQLEACERALLEGEEGRGRQRTVANGVGTWCIIAAMEAVLAQQGVALDEAAQRREVERKAAVERRVVVVEWLDALEGSARGVAARGWETVFMEATEGLESLERDTLAETALEGLHDMHIEELVERSVVSSPLFTSPLPWPRGPTVTAFESAESTYRDSFTTSAVLSLAQLHEEAQRGALVLSRIAEAFEVLQEEVRQFLDTLFYEEDMGWIDVVQEAMAEAQFIDDCEELLVEEGLRRRALYSEHLAQLVPCLEKSESLMRWRKQSHAQLQYMTIALQFDHIRTSYRARHTRLGNAQRSASDDDEAISSFTEDGAASPWSPSNSFRSASPASSVGSLEWTDTLVSHCNRLQMIEDTERGIVRREEATEWRYIESEVSAWWSQYFTMMEQVLMAEEHSRRRLLRKEQRAAQRVLYEEIRSMHQAVIDLLVQLANL